MRSPLLLVEDEDTLRLLISEALAGEGYVVTQARNGIEAIAHLRSERKFAVIVTDFNMPEGISGLEVATAAESLQPQAAVVLASAQPRDEIPATSAHVLFLPKPYRLKQLVDAIENRID